MFSTSLGGRAHAVNARQSVVFTGLTAKRLFDIVLCIIALPFVVPVIAVCALIVALDGGTIFYGHRRVGKGGESFRCWKLRSMAPNAELRLAELLLENAAARAEWAATCKLRDDPRVTRFGRFLRRSSLDELPQIWNVLRGEMSLVGPRPVIRDELVRYGRDIKAYTGLRPGITGLWQISGRNDVSYEQRVAFDRAYAVGYSLIGDFRILLATVGVVFRMTGK